MGTKQLVRERFLSTCEEFTGTEIPRQGPTDVSIDSRFGFETLFVGNKHAIESLTLVIHCVGDDPHTNDDHPVWDFIARVAERNGWIAYDTFTGKPIANAT